MMSNELQDVVLKRSRELCDHGQSLLLKARRDLRRAYLVMGFAVVLLLVNISFVFMWVMS